MTVRRASWDERWTLHMEEYYRLDSSNESEETQQTPSSSTAECLPTNASQGRGPMKRVGIQWNPMDPKVDPPVLDHLANFMQWLARRVDEPGTRFQSSFVGYDWNLFTVP